MKMLTMLEVKLNIVTSDVGGHGNDRSAVELADEMTGRHTIQVGHNNIHQYKIIFLTILDLVHCFQTVELLDVSFQHVA